MAGENNVFEITHQDSESEHGSAVAGGSGKGKKKKANPTLPTPTGQIEAVVAAVRGEFRSTKSELVAEVTNEVLPSIEAAVKRAMGQSSSTDKKRQKRHLHDLKNKGYYR